MSRRESPPAPAPQPARESTHAGSSAPVTQRTVVATWWPLAASWLLMGLELPAVSAIMARLAQPTVSLAAYGGVVFPLALLLESPIIMLLMTSTALSRDRESYRLVRRFMFLAAGATTVIHALLAFTPLYDLVVGRLIAPPPQVLEPARLGLRIMLPWTLSIAYRRFQQGVLIRFGRSRMVGIGTGVRLAANLVVLGAGIAVRTIPGIVVGTLAVTCGVMAEAVFAGLAVRPVVRHELPARGVADEPLTFARFLRFYVPLAITPMCMFLAMPLTSGAMSRMPRAIESLAVWPVLNGIVFTVRSGGFAFNEVVVALLERPGARPALARFAFALAATTSALLLAVAATPLGHVWFGTVSALPATLVVLASIGLWFAVPLPGLSALMSLYQGAIVHGRRTRGITESMVVYLATVFAVLLLGVVSQRWIGLYVGIAASTLGNVTQVAWLRLKAGDTLRRLAAASAATGATQGATAGGGMSGS